MCTGLSDGRGSTRAWDGLMAEAAYIYIQDCPDHTRVHNYLSPKPIPQGCSVLAFSPHQNPKITFETPANYKGP